MPTSKVRLYVVPLRSNEVKCYGCGALIAFVPGVNPGKKMPVSLTSPLAKRDREGPLGVVIEAPSHYTDCPAANQFSGRNRR